MTISVAQPKAEAAGALIPRRWFPLVCTFALAFLSTYGGSALPIFRDHLQSYYAINLPQLGLLLSVGMLPSALGGLVAGVMIFRRGASWVLRGSVAGVGVGAALATIGTSWGLMLVAMAIFTCFYNALFVSGQAYLAGLFPHRRRRVLSMFMVAFSLGGVLLPLWVEWLLHMEQTRPQIRFAHVLHAPFAVISVTMMAGWLAYRLHPATLTLPQTESLPLDWSGLRQCRSSALLIGSGILMGAADIALSVWMPRFLASESFTPLPLSLKPGHVMSAFMVAYLIARTGLFVTPERTGARLLLWGPSVLGGTLFIIGIALHRPVLLIGSFLVGALFWSLQVPSVMARLSEREGNRFGLVAAVFMVGSSVVGFALVNSMGWLAEMVGPAALWQILLLPAVCYPLAGMASFLWLRRPGLDQM